MITEEKFYSENRKGEYLDYYKYISDTEKENMPLIIDIHWAGGRGSELALINDGRVRAYLSRHAEYDCIVVSPQCHCDTWFELFDVLLEFIDKMRKDSRVDTRRVYLTGASMGGYTSWQIAMSRPEWFAALVPLCGGGMYWNAWRIKDIPIWAFHGALDKTVLPEETLHMASAVNQCGGNAKITICPKCDHNVWDTVYTSADMWNWMFAQKKSSIKGV